MLSVGWLEVGSVNPHFIIFYDLQRWTLINKDLKADTGLTMPLKMNVATFENVSCSSEIDISILTIV